MGLSPEFQYTARPLNESSALSLDSLGPQPGAVGGISDSTLIVLSDGQRVRAADLPPEFSVRTWDEEAGFSTQPARKWGHSVTPILRVATASGRHLRASPDHLLWTPRGWARLSEVQVGDFLGLARGDLPGTLTVDLDRAWLVGRLIASPRALSEVRQFFPDQETFQALEELGLEITRAASQSLPEEVFIWEGASLAAFVGGTVEACAKVYDRASGRQLVFEHPSEHLLTGLLSLLLRLQVHGDLRPKSASIAHPRPRLWVVRVSGSSLDHLAALLPDRGPKVQRLKGLPPRPPADRFDLIPPELLERFGVIPLRHTPRYPGEKDARVRKHGYRRQNIVLANLDAALRNNVDLAWDPVISISKEPDERVRHIEVEQTHALIANDFISHNSSPVQLLLPTFDALARLDPSDFNAYTMTDKDGKPWRVPKFHREWNALIPPYGTPARVLIKSPHNSSKTSTISVGRVLWEIGKNPNIRVRILCSDDVLAESIIFELGQHLLTNQKLHAVFPNLRPAFPWTKTQLTVQRSVIMKDPTVQSESIMGGGTGGRVGLTGETLVLTSRGLVEARSVKVHDRVLTSKGEFSLVVATDSGHYAGSIVVIRPQGSPFELRLSSEHKVLVCQRDRDNLPHTVQMEAGHLNQRDYLVFPRAKINSTHSIFSNREQQRAARDLLGNPGVWWLLGAYLGDGWVCKDSKHRNRVQFSFNALKDDAFIEKARRCGSAIEGRVAGTRRDNTFTVSITHPMLARLCRLIGTSSHGKRIPPWIQRASLRQQIEFVKGYLCADGCDTALQKVNFASCNPSVLVQLQTMLASWGVWSALHRNARAGRIWISGREAYQSDLYLLDTSHPHIRSVLELPPRKSTRAVLSDFDWWVTKEYVFIPITSLRTEDFEGPLFTIAVKGGHDICAPGAILHGRHLLLSKEPST